MKDNFYYRQGAIKWLQHHKDYVDHAETEFWLEYVEVLGNFLESVLSGFA
jgi:hypothetical protein